MSIDKELVWFVKDQAVGDGTFEAGDHENKITVRDCNGDRLATVVEQVISQQRVSKYKLLDASGKLVASSDKVQWIDNGPHFELQGDGDSFLDRRDVKGGQQWQISRSGTGLASDPRVLILLAAFRTADEFSTTKQILWAVFIMLVLIAACGACWCTDLFQRHIPRQQNQAETWQQYRPAKRGRVVS